MTNAYLKVKIKSLAAEAKIIRQDENRYLNKAAKISAQITPADLHENEMNLDDEETDYQINLKVQLADAEVTFKGLYEHRKNVVGTEQRSTLLAYAFIKKMPYHRVEASCYALPNWHRVAEIVINFFPDNYPMSKYVLSPAADGVRMRRKLDVLEDLDKWHGVIRPTNKNKYAPDFEAVK